MNQHYNQNYTKEKVAAILQRIQDCTLFNLDDKEKLVDIYTKFNIIDMDTGSRIVVISFHERNKPIDYLFR